MRDLRFVALHRGGLLNKEQHFRLMEWACNCAENVFPLLGQKPDERLIHAIRTGRNWISGLATVRDARKASLAVLQYARASNDPVTVAVARSAGHAAATAHMADHSLRAAFYALKAVKTAGKPVDAEREFQKGLLTGEIKELVLSSGFIISKV